MKTTANFSTQTLYTRRSLTDIIHALKESNCKTRVIYQAKLSFIIEEEITPSMKQNVK
jgi:hypothetical protein